jgi:hypothetical protein
MALISATGAEAGLPTREQLRIALRFLVTNGGAALMKDIDGAVEEVMNALGYTLSEQGHATLRELVNRNAVRRGWIHKAAGGNGPWRITPSGQAHVASIARRPADDTGSINGRGRDISLEYELTAALLDGYQRAGEESWVLGAAVSAGRSP